VLVRGQRLLITVTWLAVSRCARVGSVAAGGLYRDSSRRNQAFVVNEVGGLWHAAQEVPGTAALNAGGRAQISSVSCGAAGNCSAGGFYGDSSGHLQALVVNKT